MINPSFPLLYLKYRFQKFPPRTSSPRNKRVGKKTCEKKEKKKKKDGTRFTVVEENEIRKRGKVPRARSGFDERSERNTPERGR